METKQCRHCKLEIHAAARRCPHCHGYQGWIADQRDPRFLALFLAFPVAIFGAMLYFTTSRISSLTSPERTAESPRLTVQDSSYRLVSAPDGTHIYVLGHAKNSSSAAAAGVWFRVTVVGEGGSILDNLQTESKGFMANPNSIEPFRLTSVIAPAPSEVKRVDVVVSYARKPNRWD